MSERRPIAEYDLLEEAVDTIVGDDASHAVVAAFDYDYGWMDLSDPENAQEVHFRPTWFEIIGRTALQRAAAA